MIFAKGDADDGDPVLVVGLTFDELRTMIDDPGRSVAGHGPSLDPSGAGLSVIVFGGESDASLRATLRSYNPGIPDAP